MKGDFTRSTFRPQKHYTSVRMQQGRLQLDSDWNEQADIQNHLRRAQTVDMIGAGSGAASVDLKTGDRNVNSFKIVPITLYGTSQNGQNNLEGNAESNPEKSPDDLNSSDLAILPGHFYANGILCELEQESDFSVRIKPGEKLQIMVSSLTIDGRPLEKGQWLEAGSSPKQKIAREAGQESTGETGQESTGETGQESTEETGQESTRETKQENKDDEIFSLKGWQIEAVDPKNRVVTLKGDIAALETLARESNGQPMLRRVITYRTQPNYPNPQDDYEPSPHLLAYLDVWQRHITATDDSHIRENALNVPDTTTRTQTVWQLKLKNLAKTGEQPIDEGNSQPLTDTTIEENWQTFLAEEEARSQQATMTACAKLCDKSKSIRLENRLYRVEIHDSGSIAAPAKSETTNESGATSRVKTATFKWSRDNGSIVSEVQTIDSARSIILIRQSSQAAWESTAVGQWLELTTRDQEIKLQPGILVPFLSITGNQITFDSARITGASALPDNIIKVRRWDHTTEQATIPLQTGLVPIEDGIQVRFGPELSSDSSNSDSSNSETAESAAAANAPTQYKTGDYWLIPARSGPQDIEWPTDQASEAPKPLPQPPAGISHAYGLLAIATTDPQGRLTIEQPTTDSAQAPNKNNTPKRDRRVVFPPLLYAVDKRGVRGDLAISENLDVGGTITAGKLDIPGVFSAEAFRSDTYEIVSNPLDDDSPKQGVIQVNTNNSTSPSIEFRAVGNSNFTFTDGNVGIRKVPTRHALEVEGTLDASKLLQNGQPIALQNKLDLHINNERNPHKVTAADIDNTTGQIVTQINNAVNGPNGANSKINAERIVDAIANHPNETGNPHKVTAKDIDGTDDQIVQQINTSASDTKINANRIVDAIANHPNETGNPHKVTAKDIDGTDDQIVQQINTSASDTKINANRIVDAIANHPGTTTGNPHQVTAEDIDGTDDQIVQQINTSVSDTKINANRIVDAIANHPGTTTGNPHQVTAEDIDGTDDQIVQQINTGSTTKINADRIDIDLNGLTNHLNNADNENPHKVTAAQINGVDDAIIQQINRSGPNARISHEHIDIEVATHKTIKSNPHEVTAKQIDQDTDEIIKQINRSIRDEGDNERIVEARIDDAIARTNATLPLTGGTLTGDLKITNTAQIGTLGELPDDVSDNTKLFVEGDIRATQKIHASNIEQDSSITLKKDVVELSIEDAITILAQLNPVKFVYKSDREENVHAGFIAEETPTLLASSDHKAVKILDVVAVVTKAVQHQQGIVSQLINVAQRQQQEIDALKSQLAQRGNTDFDNNTGQGTDQGTDQGTGQGSG